MNKSRIFALLTNSLLLRLLTFFRPHRFVISFYLSTFFRSFAGLSNYSLLNIASGPGRNLKMLLHIGEKFDPQETHYWLGFYELDIQRQLAKIIKKGFVVYDIGAFLGFYSLLSNRLSRQAGRVYAFEPLAKNIGRLKLHILLNKMQDRVFCVPKAVTDKTGRAICHYRGHDTMSYFTNIDFNQEYYLTKTNLVVETISLDEFVFIEKHPAPNLIKIDVEGSELKVLLGAKRLLKEFKPAIIYEIHSKELAVQVYKELAGFGYRFKVLSENVEPFNLHHGHILALPSGKVSYMDGIGKHCTV